MTKSAHILSMSALLDVRNLEVRLGSFSRLTSDYGEIWDILTVYKKTLLRKEERGHNGRQKNI